MHRTFATLLTLGACTAAPSQPSATVSVASPGAGPSPRLVVLVVIDQLGTFHLDRSRDHLRGGFARMLGPDAWHGVGMHPHAKTETCPGHVTLATGAAPAVHGIPGNRFLVDGEKTYCADLALMRVESIGDVFSEAGGSVVALSLKDRAALFLAGSTPTLAAWTDKHGVLVHRPVSSGEPVAVAPPLVGAAETRAWLAEPWAALDPGAFGTLPAESPYENDHGLGLGFPKRPASEALADAPGTALKYTPAGGRYLTAAALAAVERHALGADDTPDLLTVSYSHFDGIGHAHTPASQESVDALLRLDQDLGVLMDGLDAAVGADRWSLVLTGDHGAPASAPVYVDLEPVPELMRSALAKAGLPDMVMGDGHGFWLDPDMAGDTRRQAVAVVREALDGFPSVDAVVAPGHMAPDAPFHDAYRDGYVAGRSPDIELLLAPNHIALYKPYGERGTDHGCPRDYDRAVPLLAVGPGVAAGSGEADTRTVAPSLAALAGVPAPAGATVGAGPYVRGR